MTREEAFDLIIEAAKKEWPGDKFSKTTEGGLGIGGIYHDVRPAVSTMVDTLVEDYPLFIAKASQSTKLNDVLAGKAMEMVLEKGGL
jgi:hypothetical protein